MALASLWFLHLLCFLSTGCQVSPCPVGADAAFVGVAPCVVGVAPCVVGVAPCGGRGPVLCAVCHQDPGLQPLDPAGLQTLPSGAP